MFCAPFLKGFNVLGRSSPRIEVHEAELHYMDVSDQHCFLPTSVIKLPSEQETHLALHVGLQ